MLLVIDAYNIVYMCITITFCSNEIVVGTLQIFHLKIYGFQDYIDFGKDYIHTNFQIEFINNYVWKL